MSGDIQRLFSMINQTNLPYQVFDDQASQSPASETRPAPIAREESPVIERRMPANEDVASAHAGLFRAYNVEVSPSAPQQRPLADIFRRMAEAKGA